MERIAEKPSLTLTRHYPVPPEKVWRAWTDAQALKKWWAPQPGDSVSAAELDVREGGRFRIVFGGAPGTEHECAGVYKEVVPNRKLVFTWHWPRTTPERVSVVTIEFRVSGKGTDLVFKHEQFFDEKARDGHLRGWSAALDSLQTYLSA
jgi:uncharacterized protein YndB with AHSA1/START domain